MRTSKKRLFTFEPPGGGIIILALATCKINSLFFIVNTHKLGDNVNVHVMFAQKITQDEGD